MTSQHTNRLAQETSPYLQQHAHNPVDWYPWGAEAFERARREDRPIFLSVGYSACYWCHVMERESFENEAIAAEMNRSFVCIKVDREERPDVDQLYMTAVQMMTQSGGWPMSVFLTPALKPFYGGTYFPPADMSGRPGLPTLLRHLSEAWRERREEVEKAADGLTDALRHYALPSGSEMSLTIDGAFIDNIVGRSIADYDRRWGGFGGAPKFPRETLLELLLAYCDQIPRETPAKSSIRQMLEHTLEMMARGGIRDQLGGAFHRYSTDARWLVPHFEIMLYDNAMLLGIYAWAAGALGRPDFASVARGIGQFILNDMIGPQGQFYTAFDAEVDGREGASHLWTREQVARELSSDEAAVINVTYGLDLGPNFADPHHGSGEPESNVLYMPQTFPELAKRLGAPQEELERIVASARAKLLAARRNRKGPMLDTKVLTSWNALMIRGMALAGRLLDEPTFTAAAERAMSYLLGHHRTPDLGLYRSSRDGAAKVSGFLDDYAAVAHALLELHRTTGSEKWLTEANGVVEQMQRRFTSPAGALYFTDAGAEEVLVRQIVGTDSPLPSGNAIAARVLLEMGRMKDSEAIITAFADQLDAHGEAYAALLQATIEQVARGGNITTAPRDLAQQLQQITSSAGAAVTASAQRLDERKARVLVKIAPGFHVYAADAPPGLYPTRVTVDGDGGARLKYPAKSKDLPLPDGGSAGVYEGEVAIDLEADGPIAGRNAVLAVQPCSENACLAQMRIVVQL